MKILQTPARCYPYIGGVERHAYQISQELAKRGHEVEILCANQPKGPAKEEIKGITVHRLFYPFKIYNTNVTPTFPLKLLSKDCDVIHTYFPGFWSSDFSSIIGKIRKIPVIYHYYNDVIDRGIKQIYNSTVLKLSLNLAKRILVAHDRYVDYSFILPKYRE